MNVYFIRLAQNIVQWRDHVNMTEASGSGLGSAACGVLKRIQGRII
jgi:hypothetical protein